MNSCLYCTPTPGGRHHWTCRRALAQRETPLKAWERELLTGGRAHREGEADVTFTRLDGSTVKFEDVRVDSVNAVTESQGIIAFEFFGTSRVIHLPFVSYWEFDYIV